VPPEQTNRSPTAGVNAPKRATLSGRIAARFIWLIVSCLSATLRWRWQDDSGLFEKEPEGPVIFCLWHNRLALSLILYHRYVGRRWQHRKLAAMVSASRDGGMLARVLELFNVQPIRGSSSRRGSQALREAVAFGERGLDLAITPDGPRGPCYEVHPGIISLGQITGYPIVPVSYHVNWKIRLKSWDRFQIPLPFACCTVQMGKPFQLERDLEAEDAEPMRLELTQAMLDLTNDE
jgi:lysophospholipid acyltransferase (LPLAT)-like uncharacterized protein